MTSSILLHMPEHSQDISIHGKPFLKIHDIEARLNPINKLNLIVLTLYYLLYSNIFIYIYNINRYVKPALRWYFLSNQFIFTNTILQKRSVAFYMNVSVFVLIQQTIATIDFLLVEFDTNSFLHFFLDIFKYRPNIK